MLTKGSLRRHGDGTYFVRPYLGTNAVTGKPLRPYKSFPAAADADEALAMANEWYATIATAAELGVQQRLGDVLMRYVDLKVDVSPNTAKAYRSWVRNYVEPYIGDMDPDRVGPATVSGLYGVLLVTGGRKGGGVSPSTVTGIHWMLSGAWRWMVRTGVCAYNPMPSVVHPSPVAAEAVALSSVDVERVSGAVESALARCARGRDVFERNAAMAAYIALANGTRCGETCAVRLRDAWTGRGSMHIGGTVVEDGGRPWRRSRTKGGTSRNVATDEEVCRRIDGHIEWQRGYLGAAAGDPDRPLLTVDGGFLRPTKVSAWFSLVRDELGLPKEITFHSLRHTHATWLLLEGFDIRTIQERLGHADVATTLRIYAHILPGRDAMAAQAFARRMRGGGHALR